MLEEGEMGPWKGTKQQKMVPEARSRRSQSVESREEQHRADVRVTQHIWSPRLEVDRAPIPWGASVREFQKGRVGHITKALEQPLLLPKDMDGYRRLKKNDIFLSLKKDLVMVNCLSIYEFTYQITFLFLTYSIFMNFWLDYLTNFCGRGVVP